MSSFMMRVNSFRAILADSRKWRINGGRINESGPV